MKSIRTSAPTPQDLRHAWLRYASIVSVEYDASALDSLRLQSYNLPSLLIEPNYVVLCSRFPRLQSIYSCLAIPSLLHCLEDFFVVTLRIELLGADC